jgi:C3HC zinc finger-like/Rsm1-like
MSYAIETKKRKWDRLVESFTDRSPSRPSTAAPQNTSTTSLIPTFEEELAKKRRLEVFSAVELAKNTSTVSLTSNYLPSNRAAFLERLETFRSVTKWHIPSTESINAAEWAKRGWTCVDTDTVSCGMCGERFYVKVDLDDDADKENGDREQLEPDSSQIMEDDDSYAAVVEVYESIVKKFAEMIVTAHADGCQWKRRGCDASIQRVEGLLNMPNVIASLRNRYDGLASNDSKVPETQLLSKRGEDAEKEIRRFQFEENARLDINALRLAICGWQVKSDDVFECRNCFRSLGLWLYRGEQPAMERLDAVESHLEYCPWRSAAAQQTEIAASERDENGSQIGTEKVAGWQLVSQAMKLDNAKRRRKTLEPGDSRPPSANSEDLSSTGTAVEGVVSPEQREKRMKALLKRINAVKKPFNVKGLLKRKEAKA